MSWGKISKRVRDEIDRINAENRVLRNDRDEFKSWAEKGADLISRNRDEILRLEAVIAEKDKALMAVLYSCDGSNCASPTAHQKVRNAIDI